MRIELDIKKTPEQNAGVYFDRAKKARKKLEGAKTALAESRKKLEKLLAKQAQDVEEKQQKKVLQLQKKWYEKFRWFISSEGFLVIGGRDATSNEIVVKKHTDQTDIIFHTQMAGSPFFVIKTEGKKPGKETLEETAIATASFSRAWKSGLSIMEVFYVNPDQVSKTTKSGEYMNKGSFMIDGKTNEITAQLMLEIGLTDDGKVMCAAKSAVQKNCKKHLTIIQGKEKTSDTAKKIRNKIGGELDDIIASLPSGGCKIKN